MMNVTSYETWIGWPLLLLQFILAEPWRECALAIQTIICSVVESRHTYHIASIIVTFQYIACPEHISSLFFMFMYHILLVCAVCAQYAFKEKGMAFWIALAWCMHWIGSLSANPWRHVVKCILFHQVASTCLVGKPLVHGFKWSWLIISHEAAWCMIPVQMLYEVYIEKETQIPGPLFE